MNLTIFQKSKFTGKDFGKKHDEQKNFRQIIFFFFSGRRGKVFVILGKLYFLSSTFPSSTNPGMVLIKRR